MERPVSVKLKGALESIENLELATEASAIENAKESSEQTQTELSKAEAELSARTAAGEDLRRQLVYREAEIARLPEELARGRDDRDSGLVPACHQVSDRPDLLRSSLYFW